MSAAEHRLEHVVGAPDVDHDAVLVQPFGDERDRDREGRAVQRLRRAEHGAAERMRDHDVVGYFDGEHVKLLFVQPVASAAG